jgi:hypothetical protein
VLSLVPVNGRALGSSWRGPVSVAWWLERTSRAARRRLRADGFAIDAVVTAAPVKRSLKFVLDLFDLVFELLQFVALVLRWLSRVVDCGA